MIKQPQTKLEEAVIASVWAMLAWAGSKKWLETAKFPFEFP
jgi:hypothetical protein